MQYSPSDLTTKNSVNSQIFIIVPGEDSVISLLNSYLDLNFAVLHAATNNRNAEGNDMRLVNLGPIALLSKYNLTNSSGKNLEAVSHAHIVSLMYKLSTSSKRSDDLSFGFARDRDRRKRELTNNKNQEGKYYIRTFFEDSFGFGEHQEKATYGLGHKLTITGNIDNTVLNKADATIIGKIKINPIEWYAPHYTPSIPQQAIFSMQLPGKIPTEFHFV